MKHKTLLSRILSWVLTASLLSSSICSMSITALAEETTGGTASPGITIAAVGTDGGKYLEVGLSIQSGSSPFQSAGTILEYDPEILTPLNWEDERTVTVGAISAADPEYWDKATVLPTKASDQTAGKTAMAYLSADQKKGYLYLSAEAAKTMKQFNQTLPAEAATPSAIGTTTNAGIATKTIESAAAPVNQAVTVRFQVNADKTATGGAIYAIDSALNALDLVQDKTAGNIAAADPVLATSPVYSTSGAMYVSSNETSQLLTEQIQPDVSFLLVKQGQTVNSGTGGGSADSSDFFTLAFYDWDETLLGMTILPKSANEEQIKETINAFVKTKYAVADGFDFPTTLPADLTNESFVDDEKFPLTYKLGYNFAGWVEVNGEGTETLNEAFTAYETIEAFQAAEKSFADGDRPEDGWGNMILKAGYVENEKCNMGKGTNFYTITDYSYNRYGASGNDNAGNYSIKFLVNRKNEDGNGVSRTKSIGLRVLMTTESGNVGIYTLTEPQNKDEFQSEVIVPKSMRSVSITVIEQEGAANYINASGRSVTNKSVINKNTTSVISQNGFVYEGTIVFINEQGILYNTGQSNSWGQVNARAFIDAKLTNADGSEMTSTQVNIAKTYLLTALQSNGNQALTQKQMLHAVQNSGELTTP